jgi:hypothetical protein
MNEDEDLMPETQKLFLGSFLLLAVKICAPYATYFTAEALRTLRGSLKMKNSANSVDVRKNPRRLTGVVYIGAY